MNQLKTYGLTESKLLEAIGEHLGTEMDAIKYIRTISLCGYVVKCLGILWLQFQSGSFGGHGGQQ